MQKPSNLILVVDDDEDIGNLVCSVLEQTGLKTLLASSGKDALAIFVPEVGILLTDSTMPGMDGQSLADRLLLIKPTLRVLFMSGSLAPAQINCIRKPFRLNDVKNFVQSAVDSLLFESAEDAGKQVVQV
jgi:two-component system cell cycle sensor histidine kinase/response regulator CckA